MKTKEPDRVIKGLSFLHNLYIGLNEVLEVFVSLQRSEWKHLISYCGSFIVLFYAFVAPAYLHSQNVQEEYHFFFEGTEDGAGKGKWALERRDQDAQAYGNHGVIRSGKVTTRPHALPDYEKNGLKLQRAGVIPFEGEYVLGAEWDYEHAILHALENLSDEIPLSHKLFQEWSDNDQNIRELGRGTLPYLEAARGFEGRIHLSLQEAFQNIILQEALKQAPEKVLPLPESFDAFLKDSRAGKLQLSPQALALLRLGPQIQPLLSQLLTEEFSNDQKALAWGNWVEAMLEEIETSIKLALEGDSVNRGLQSGMPLSKEDPSQWPEAELRFAFDIGLAAIPTLESLRSTRHDFATKASWLIQKIRSYEASSLFERLTRMALENKLQEQYFDKSLQDLASLGDFVVLVTCTKELESLLKQHVLDAERMAILNPDDDQAQAQSQAMLQAAALIEKTLHYSMDPGYAFSTLKTLENIRNNPPSIHTLADQLKTHYQDFSMNFGGIGLLIQKEAQASRKQAKLNWLIEQVQARDLAALRQALIPFVDSRKAGGNANGKLDPQEEKKLESTYKTMLQTGYLKKLQEQGFVLLPGGESFHGDTSNNGLEYDHQHDIARRGLSIELEPADFEPLPLELSAGNTYTLSFEYFSHNLNSQSSWVRFIPLGADGEPLYNFLQQGENYDKSVEEGKFIPFNFARDREDEEKSNKAMGTSNGWEKVFFTLRDVPEEVAGLNFEIKVEALTGNGRIYYRNFSLKNSKNYFYEGFEPNEHYPSDFTEPLPPPLWERVYDPERNYTAYSKLKYNTFEKGREGERCLQVEPNGFNVRLVSRRFFRLRPDRNYVFQGQLRTEKMEDMKACFEVLLFDENKNPLNIDGIPTTLGNNILTTPARGDITKAVGWQHVRSAEGWFNEILHLNDMRDDDLREGYNPLVDKRERKNIAFIQIAIVIEGPRPVYGATVCVDAIQLQEYPRVRLNLGMATYKEESGIEDIPLSQDLQGPLAEIETPEGNTRYKLYLEAHIRGLQKNRTGYHYTLSLQDYRGNDVPAADNLGQSKLDGVIYSDRYGKIGSNALPKIYIDDFALKNPNGLANRYGYFQARFILKYLDQEESLIDQVFHIGFLPESHLLPGEKGEFGVVYDHISKKQRRVFDALQKLRAGRLAFPLLDQKTSLDPSIYKDQDYIENFEILARSFPEVQKIGIFGPLPQELEALYFKPGANAVLSDSVRDEWKDLMLTLQEYWRDTFSAYSLGNYDDQSYTTFTGDPAKALDNFAELAASNKQTWVGRQIPVVLHSEEKRAQNLDVFQRSFSKRWPAALQEMDPETVQTIENSLSVDEQSKLQELSPQRLWLRKRETLNFFIPENLSIEDMKSGLQAYLSQVGRFENILGNSPQEALQSAQTLVQQSSFNFDQFAQELMKPSTHTVVIDLKTIDYDSGLSSDAQLRDLTQKIVAAKELGFSNIYVSRLRSQADKHNGLLTQDNFALPSFFAFRTLNALLSFQKVFPLQLKLNEEKHHVFFEDEDGELTFIAFPGSQDSTEELPFGNHAEQVDLMGNTHQLEALTSSPSNGATPFPSGRIQVRFPGEGLPVIIKNIDKGVLRTIASLNLDNPTLQAQALPQAKKLTITNHFDDAQTFNLEISATGKAQSILKDARFMDALGKRAEAGSHTFESIKLLPGESHSFDFQIWPYNRMPIEERTLPIKLKIHGAGENYELVKQIGIQVQPLVEVTSLDVMESSDHQSYELSFVIQNATQNQGTFLLSAAFPEFEKLKPVSKMVELQASGQTQTSLTILKIPKEYLLSKKSIQISLQESPGINFFNKEYFLHVNENEEVKILPAE